jgi:hypothetical protein
MCGVALAVNNYSLPRGPVLLEIVTDDGGSRFILRDGKYLPDYVSHSRRQYPLLHSGHVQTDVRRTYGYRLRVFSKTFK